MVGEKMYTPALIRLPAKVRPCSTKRSTRPVSCGTTTLLPYLAGSSIRVTMIVPTLPCALWKSRSERMLNSHAMSQLSTKKGSPSSRRSCASASGPAVPSGSVSCESVIFTPKSWCFSRKSAMISAR